MVKKIIHCGDVHIPNFKRLDEYKEQLHKFIEQCNQIVCAHQTDEVRIVISGDLVHSKTDLSPECYHLTSWFLSELDKICKTIVIAGNHDITLNMQRLDPLTVIFSMCKFNQVLYLDKLLNYKSGILEDDNITWCLYSIFDNFTKPSDIDILSREGKTFVALFHGDVNASKTDAGYVSEYGFDVSYFSGCDIGMFGHIHKRQSIEYQGKKFVYCGSLIQQDFGENLSNHGFLVWDVEKRDYDEVNLENKKYGFYNFLINNDTDISDDKEEILNS